MSEVNFGGRKAPPTTSQMSNKRKARADRQQVVNARLEIRDARTDAEQLKELDKRPGESKKERARLLARMGRLPKTVEPIMVQAEEEEAPKSQVVRKKGKKAS